MCLYKNAHDEYTHAQVPLQYCYMIYSTVLYILYMNIININIQQQPPGAYLLGSTADVCESGPEMNDIILTRTIFIAYLQFKLLCELFAHWKLSIER